MKLRRTAGCVAGLVLCVAARGQSGGTEGWYPADAKDAVPGFTAGPVGKPFAGIAVWTKMGRDPAFGDFYQRQARVRLMRDGAGRERMEWATAASDTSLPGASGTWTMLVLDPVARCVFVWVETADSKALPTGTTPYGAKVRCEPTGVTPEARPRWDALTEGEKADLLKEPESKPHFVNERIGSKEIGGVKADGYRREEVRTFDQGKREEKESVGELWYSPALDVGVQTAGGPRSFSYDEQESFTLTEVKLGEPAATVFRPPAGTAIDVDTRLAVRWQTGFPRASSFLSTAWTMAKEEGAWPDVDSAAMTKEALRNLHPEFPAAWYPKSAENLIPGMYAGKQDRPLVTAAEMHQYKPGAGGKLEPTGTMPASITRDAQGRTRLEYGYVPAQAGFRSRLSRQTIGAMVYVADPVSRCLFQWFEGVLATKPLTAKVRCSSLTASIPPTPGWEEPIAAEKEEIAKAGAGNLRFVDVKTGEETVNGIRTEVYRRYAVRREASGRPQTRKDVGGRWYAPSLDEVVKATMMQPGAGGAKPEELETFEIDAVREGDVGAEFYPPRGYAIEVDPTLVPPAEQKPEKTK